MSVSDFCAFEGAGDLECVKQAFVAPLKALECGIAVGKPVEVDLKLTPTVNFNGLIGAISPMGFAIIYNSSAKGIHMFNLKTSDCAFIPDIPEYCWIAAHEDRVIVGRLDAVEMPGEHGVQMCSTVYHANVKKLFETPKRETFKTVHVPQIMLSSAYTDMCPWTGTVIFVPSCGDPCLLDVRTMEIRRIDVYGEEFRPINLTSISHHGIKVLYRNEEGIHILDDDDQPNEPFLMPKGWPRYCVPSESDIDDLTKAMWIVWSDGEKRMAIWYQDNLHRFPAGFEPCPCFSLMRIYRDVFFGFNWATRKWCTVRLVVP